MPLMLLKDKFPELENNYSNKNQDNFSDVIYKSTQKLFWTNCSRGHLLYKTPLEFKRYPNCSSCSLIDKNNIEYEETLAYLYPEIANLMDDINLYAADAIRPDSKLKAHWKDRSEKIAVSKRVSEAIKSQKVERVHYGSKKILRDKKSVKTPSKNHVRKVNKTATKPLFREQFPEYASWLKNDESFTIGSNKKTQWVCPQGHEFESSVRNFIKRTNKCTVCSGIICISGVNDIKTTHPDIACFISLPPAESITSSYSGDVDFCCPDCGFEWTSPLPYRKFKNERKSFNCPACYGKVVRKGYNDLLSFMPQIKKYWHENNTFGPDEVTFGSEKIVLLNCSTPECDNIVPTYPYVLTRNSSKTQFLCSSCQGSTGEKELLDLVKSWGFKCIENDRLILGGKELDIYIPSKRIAIEFNGVYWHSSAVQLDKNYHYEKWKACKDKNIQLITVWEDDWRNKRDLIIRSIEYKLGVSQQEKVFARKTYVENISELDARNFLNQYHIQGSVNGCKNYGLLYNGDVISIMSVKKRDRSIIIDRYATSYSVPGGFTKLLTHVLKNNSDINKVITFSDHTVSNGGLYANNGFIADKEIDPDYMYVYRQSRYHKFNFRKSRFRDDDNLLYDPDMSESELARLNGIPRIWDAGKTRWVLQIS